MFELLTGLEYLKCEIACKHDKALEKGTWNERAIHFASLDLEDKATFKKASNPIGLRAAVLAYQTSLKGEASGYMISLDATSSGLQILSMLVSCPKSFNLCGGNSDRCVDSYVEIYNSMQLHGAITRKKVKNAIMTALYGSTNIPESVFGDNIDLFYDTMVDMAPGAWKLNLGLQELWDEVSGSDYSWVMPDGFNACIETQDKERLSFKFLDVEHTVDRKINSRPKFHKGLGPNIIHSIDGMIVREMLRRCMFNIDTVNRVRAALDNPMKPEYALRYPGKSSSKVLEIWDYYQESGYLSVRILDYIYDDTIGLIDADIILSLLNSLPNKPFDVVTVHDCFRAHPNYGNVLRRQYNICLADLNDSNLLENIAKQIAHDDIETEKVGKIPRATILESNYSLS